MIPDSICTLYWILNVERAENTGQDMNFWQRSRFSRHISRNLWIYFFTRGKCFFTWRIYFHTRSSVNHLEDWLDQFFILPGLEKGFTSMWSPATIIMCVRPFAAWWHPTSQPSNQPVDPRASLLLTSEFGKRHVNWVPFLCYANLRKPSKSLLKAIDIHDILDIWHYI